jgi:hypothetical protein
MPTVVPANPLDLSGSQAGGTLWNRSPDPSNYGFGVASQVVVLLGQGQSLIIKPAVLESVMVR